ncbi:glycosyltransferase [Paeniglutamicibacter sp. NPDC012692]|uniref:glycosyltransferase n=1 Tax=Paeniglutamicibacter sp. NPDC012692 TaxID=3364388 RepID=UPI0036A443E6
MSFDIFLSICIIFSLGFGTLFLAYVFAIIIPFLRRKPGAAGDPDDFEWHFALPCRDEEVVIGDTITYMRSTFPECHVWVIDDDSDDATAEIVHGFTRTDSRVHLIQRRRPEARTGKAHALNFGYKIILKSLQGQDLSKIILVVCDADGRPSSNLQEVCAGPGLFGDDEIAAVQVEVRMSNRVVHTPYPEKGKFANLFARTFVRLQDLEFRGPISAIQMSRKYSGTVNVGGNGQLNRMSALAEIADEKGPWRGSLLEDFELGIHFIMAGWHNGYTPDAWVDQEALYSVRRFLTQRARWSQGTMQCNSYLKRIWLNPNVTNLGALELSYFLIQPWVTLLGTVLYPVPMILMAYNFTMYPAFAAHFLANGGAILLTAYLVVGIGEFVVWGFLYRKRCEPEETVLTALGWGLSFFLYLYTVYIIVWKAFYRIVKGQDGWVKTIRNAENVSVNEAIARPE